MASSPSSLKSVAPPVTAMEDSAQQPASSLHHKMSPRNRALFFVTAWLIVLMPFLFWWNTWFGRQLPDKQIRASAPNPACSRPTRRAHGTPQRRRGALVSRNDPAVFVSHRGSAQYRCLGYGAGYFRPRLSRDSPENAPGSIPDGPWQCRPFAGPLRRRFR